MAVGSTVLVCIEVRNGSQRILIPFKQEPTLTCDIIPIPTPSPSNDPLSRSVHTKRRNYFDRTTVTLLLSLSYLSLLH